MKYLPTLIKSSPLYPVLVLESWLSGKTRKFTFSLSQGLVLTFVISLIVLSFSQKAAGGDPSVLVELLRPKLTGLLLLSLGLLILSKLLDYYFTSSYYFDNVVSNNYKPEDIFTFTVGRILYRVKDEAVLKAFLLSDTGKKIMARLGIDEAKVSEFIASRPEVLASKLPLSAGEVLTLKKLVQFLFEENPDFNKFLFENSVRLFELIGATEWVVKEIEAAEYDKRWWREDRLMRIPGLARDWAYGRTYVLEKYSHDLLEDPATDSTIYNLSAREEEIKQIVTVLSREREANIILVGESVDENLDVIYHFGRRIKEGNVPANIEFKRPLLFNSSLFISAFKDRASLEAEFLESLNEAVKVGNVILVIDNLAALLSGAQALSSNLLGLMQPYLSSNAVQIIALVSSEAFHQYLQPNQALMDKFERVFVKPLPPEKILQGLQEAVWRMERKYGLFFTYPALLEIVKDAETYFADSVSADKSVDLLIEIIPWLGSQNISLVTKNEVSEFVESKTNIPLGEVAGEEKDKLLNLEKLLHERVIGQEEAINQISNALRRARAGIRNPNRPIGSFLFLGPTGVGKTETAKALSAVFFGNESAMVRLDMSEYQTDDSVARLIGSFSSDRPGILASLVREHPYGVVLLDEFEKTHKEVQNLFLQILDEGFFSDAQGRRINVRNLLFIATSNAAAEMIWEMVEKGTSPNTQTNDIISEIVRQAIFKPELLNRFDAVVLFHPLSEENLKQVAKLLLKKLAKRLEAQGIKLEESEELAAQVAKLGANRVFGARPMQRFIQDNIEQQIADKIIRGEIHSGSVVQFAGPSADEQALSPLVLKEL